MGCCLPLSRPLPGLDHTPGARLHIGAQLACSEKGPAVLEVSDEEQPSAAPSSSSSNVEQVSDHVSEVHTSEEDAPASVPTIRCQSKTFTYHLPDLACGEGSACKTRIAFSMP